MLYNVYVIVVYTYINNYLYNMTNVVNIIHLLYKIPSRYIISNIYNSIANYTKKI